ncbi:MAG: hypothetical protein WB615_08520 [Candidatus Tumulicola sp.]
MKLLSIGIAFALAMLGQGALASEQTVQLQVTVFPCATDSAAAPSLRAWALQRPPAQIAETPAWERIGSVWQASLTLAPGPYMLSAESPHCSGEGEPWVAIPGAQRHLALTVNRMNVKSIDGDSLIGIIYGSLPAPAATVEVMRAGSLLGEQTRRSVPTDGDTYQIGYLHSGPYVVRITFGNVVVSRDVTIGRTLDAAAVRADLSTGDAAAIVQQQATGSRFVHVPNGQKIRAVSFELGAASADGWTTQPLAPPSDYRTDVQRINALTAGALASAQRFLADNSQIPATFKTLSAWSVDVLNNVYPNGRGNANANVVIDLRPANLQAWQQRISNSRDQCLVFAGDHYVRLTIDSKTWKVNDSRICP